MYLRPLTQLVSLTEPAYRPSAPATHDRAAIHRLAKRAVNAQALPFAHSEFCVAARDQNDICSRDLAYVHV